VVETVVNFIGDPPDSTFVGVEEQIALIWVSAVKTVKIPLVQVRHASYYESRTPEIE
jgi:hypothetical protein